MDINQLKLILDSVKDVSELTAGVAVLWILVSQIMPYALGAYGIYTVSRILNRLVVAPFNDHRTVIGIRDTMMPNYVGTMMSTSERRAVNERLSRLREVGLLGRDLPDLSQIVSRNSGG